ncbi:MAG: hypothetical protein Q8891_06020 [Bacteroidota bacterium]|nr:hypothetical protein [Bacteroidota bacterium]
MISEQDNKTIKSDFRITASRNLDIIIKGLLKKWWLFLIVGVLAGIIGIYYASKQKMTYKSSLTFALDTGDGSSGAISLAAQFGLNLGSSGDIFAGDNIIEIMKSRRMVEGTLLSIDTFQNKPYTFIEYYLQQSADTSSKQEINIHFPVGQLRSTFTYAQDSLLYKSYNDFANNYINADKPDRKYNIYEVNVTNPDEKFTKDFTDRLVAETNKFYTEISTKKAKETLDILEQRVAAMKGNVDSGISSKAEIQDINLNPVFSAAQVPVLKQQANIQVYGGAYAEMFKNLEIARYQYLKQIPLMQIIDAANYPMEKVKASRLKTAIIFSFIACFFTFLILWIISLFKLKTD